ncbi:hypothetical protein [Clostridium hydrogenum]|uniref:hypothetical protein n=1 Tax=Clostridium hydrogenum TaxID=2855764 RepID=UPI001F412C06|nr:hypothetical protein [Clostridium hydrogenum]
MLNEIRGSIDKISDKIEIINKTAVNNEKVQDIEREIEKIKFRSTEDYSKIKLAVTTSICTGIIGTILGFIFSKK